MVTEVPIRVRISSREAAQGKDAVVRSLKDIRREAANTNQTLNNMGKSVRKGINETTRAVDLLKQALLALGGIAVVRKIVDLGNTFTELKNRVLITSNGFDEASFKLERLFNIANRNRGPIEELVSLFQKGSIASRELGASQEEMFKFVDLVAKGLAIQGGATNTARGALLQLSQALGSGIVRAEEFNSILEGAFPIAQAAAKGLDRAGGSVARLRQLIITGQVTSTQFFRALLSQAEDLRTTFQKIRPTVRQAGIVFQNNLIRLFERSEGIFSAVAVAIIGLSNNMETLAKVTAVAGITLAVAFSPRLVVGAITLITRAVQGLTVAIATNPIGAIAVAVTAAVSSLVLFSNEIKLTSNGLATLSDLISVFIEDISVGFAALSGFLGSVFGPFLALIEETFGKVEFSVAGFLRATAFAIDRFIGLWRGAFNAIVETFRVLPEAFAAIFTAAMNNSIRIVESGVNSVIGILNKLPGVDIGTADLGVLGDNQTDLSQLGGRVGQAFTQGFTQDTIADNVERALVRAEEKAKERIAAIEQRKIDMDKLIKGDVSKKMGDQLNKAKVKLNEFGKTFKNIIGTIEDSLVEFVRTGKLDFKELINSILDDLARLAIRQFVTAPLANAIGSASGSFFTQAAGAAGGSIFGFDQGVNFVPRDMVAQLHRGERVVPALENRRDQQRGDQPIIINMNMPNITDAASFRRNQSQITSSLARSLQQSTQRNN